MALKNKAVPSINSIASASDLYPANKIEFHRGNRFCVGDIIRITGNSNGHGWRIGQDVYVVYVRDDGILHTCEKPFYTVGRRRNGNIGHNGKIIYHRWWVRPEECELIDIATHMEKAEY